MVARKQFMIFELSILFHGLLFLCVCASLHLLIHVATRGTMFISMHKKQYLKNKSEGKLAIAESEIYNIPVYSSKYNGHIPS